MDARLVARDPRLPLLHDHGSEDDPRRARSAPRVRGRRRVARDAPDRAVHDRVRDEGRSARGAVPRLCRTTPPRSGRLGLVRTARAATLGTLRSRRLAVGALTLAGALVFTGLVVAAGIPARPTETSAVSAPDSQRLPDVTVVASDGVARIDRRTAMAIARDVVADLDTEAEALRTRNRDRAAVGATGAWLATLWEQIPDERRREIVVPAYDVRRDPAAARTRSGSGPADSGRTPRRSACGPRRAAALPTDGRARPRARPLPDQRARRAGCRSRARRHLRRAAPTRLEEPRSRTSRRKSAWTSGTAHSAPACRWIPPR